jgi:hypothetical protein
VGESVSAGSAPLLALVSLHHGHHNKSKDFSRAEASDTWTAAALDFADLIDHISCGKAFVNCQLDGPRKTENCRASNLIILDVDGDITLEEFWAIPFAQRHCAFTYTSCSHLDDAKQQERGSRTNHSFRALFPAEPIDIGEPGGTELYAERYHLLLERLGLQLKDASPAKAAQLWYGNDAAQVQLGQALPLDWEFTADAVDRVRAKAMGRQRLQAAATPQFEDDGLIEQRAIAVLELGIVRHSQEGEYHYWVQVLNAAAAFQSEAVYQAFLIWHHNSFHGQGRKGKPAQKVTPKRWQGAGTVCPQGTLLKLAKEQDPNWYQLLPEALRWKSTAPPVPQVLYSKASPTVGAALPTDIKAPDTVPSPQELARFQEEAARHLYSGSGGGGTTRPEQGESPWDGAQQLHNLLHQLYLLRTHGLCVVNGKREMVPNHLKAEEDRKLLSAIMECRGYANSPAEVERDLIRHFRWNNGLYRDESAPVARFTLSGNPDNSVQWLVPNWFLAKREHVIYSKAGVGKTMLAIHLARALTGDPAIDVFLDSGPLDGTSRWRQSQVLFIATDMHDSAYEQTETYLASLGLSGKEFLKHIEWWMEDHAAGSPAWTLTLSNLLLLYNHLKAQQEKGIPVSAVIIDSMKEVCPEHLLVGQQAFKDYLRLAYDICSRFDAALIWIHHASANNNGAQGIQRITEAASAVFKLERDENRQIKLSVDKLRGGRGRDLIIDPFAQDKPRLVAVVSGAGAQVEPEDDGPVLTNTERRRMQILDVLQMHFAAYKLQYPDETGAKLALTYKGMSAPEIKEAGVEASTATLNRDLTALVNTGEIETRGYLKSATYRVRLNDNGEPAEPLDLFTAGG